MNMRHIFTYLQQPLVDWQNWWEYVKREMNVFGIIINARRPTFMLLGVRTEYVNVITECMDNKSLAEFERKHNFFLIPFRSWRSEILYTQYSTVLDRLKCGVLFLLDSEYIYIYIYRDSAHHCSVNLSHPLMFGYLQIFPFQWNVQNSLEYTHRGIGYMQPPPEPLY